MPRPSIAALKGAGPKCHIVAVYNLKSEIFGENLKIHAGGDDKLRIQFAWPNNLKYEIIINFEIFS